MSSEPTRNPVPGGTTDSPYEWEDITGTYYACYSVAHGDGYWPSMLSFDVELDGTITAADARSLAAYLIRGADECDASTDAALARAAVARAEEGT